LLNNQLEMADFHSVLYKIIGKRISELRRYNNDNQQQLAEKIGLKRSTISNIELGRQLISLHWLYRIAQIYNAEIYSLLPRVEDLAGKPSFALENLSEIVEQKNLGARTKKQILQLLK
jgi:transcriptional regulator with XRE-family HTH domain